MAWSAQAEKEPGDAVAILHGAADEEDGIEKLPATPGPIIPAREQLGELLLEQGDPTSAPQAFETALANAPGRRGALLGAACALGAIKPKPLTEPNPPLGYSSRATWRNPAMPGSRKRRPSARKLNSP
jgi:hypothetical protein